MACLLLLLTAAGPVHGRSTRRSPVRAAPALEWPLALTVGLAASALPSLLVPELRDAPPCGDCDPSTIALWPDRAVVNNHSDTAARVSDVLLLGLIAGALSAGLWADGDAGPSRRWTDDALVATEALALNFVVANVVKVVVARPRPYAYNPSVSLARRHGRSAGFSFFSGHTSGAFCAATTLSVAVWDRHHDPLARGLTLGLSLATASAVGYLRVHAGRHFWSDVVVGALVGGGLGLLVAHLHRDPDRAAFEANDPRPVGTTPMTLSWRF